MKPEHRKSGGRAGLPLRLAFVSGYAAVVLLGFLLLHSAVCLCVHAQSYTVPWHKIAAGGGTSTNEEFSISGTIGQVDAGRVADTNGVFRVDAGFWAIAIQQMGYPRVNVARAGTNYFVSWLTAEPGLILQHANTLGTPTVWSDVPATVATNGLTNLVQPIIAPGTGSRFYRLRRP